MDIEIGLGYDPLAKDYKIVSLIFASRTTRLQSVAIYTLGAGSWKIIPFQGNGTSSSWWRPKPLVSGNVCLKGCLYFIADDDNYNNGLWDLVSFDLSNEVFSVVARMPDNPPSKQMALIDGGPSLAVLTYSYPNGCVWVLDSETMYWTKRCSYRWNRNEVLFVKKNGDILIARTLIYRNESGQREEVVSYSPRKQEYKILQEYRGDDFIWITDICADVESLILHSKSDTNI